MGDKSFIDSRGRDWLIGIVDVHYDIFRVVSDIFHIGDNVGYHIGTDILAFDMVVF